jgi:hypothetical protein
MKFAMMLVLIACAAPACARRLGPALKYGRLEEDLNGDSGSPAVDFSEMLREGDIAEAREKARVQGIGNVTSFSGFFTSDNETDNHMFW